MKTLLPTLLLLSLAASLCAEMRTWKDATGKFELQAKLIEVKDGTVLLRTSEGKNARIRVTQLSAADQAFLKESAPAAAGAVAGNPLDWSQFRGPDHLGMAAAALPDTWSDTENIVWKIEIEGLGTSSPVVFGDKVFVTTASGGADDVSRHVLCLEAATGKVLWDTAVESDLPEQTTIRESHGYASATPVVTPNHVIVFFGKSGVFCFDHAGKQIWNTKVGSQLNGWGSAASLSTYGKAVLVNASVESESLLALDQASGKELWKASGIKECWHAPALVKNEEGKTEVVTALMNEVKAFDAETGDELWRCETGIPWYMCPTPVAKDGIVYVVGGRSGVGGAAIRTGGKGDVTGSHRLWTLEKGTNVPSPILHEGHLYFASDSLGVAHCVDAKTGQFVYSERLDIGVPRVYASPLLAGGKIYYFGAGGKTAVLSAKPSFEMVSTATLEGGRGVFNASPAVVGNRLLLRSNKFLYCIGK